DARRPRPPWFWLLHLPQDDCWRDERSALGSELLLQLPGRHRQGDAHEPPRRGHLHRRGRCPLPPAQRW
ncbi:hypothetical protein BN1708_019491, partial [Verticillium longisporum]